MAGISHDDVINHLDFYQLPGTNQIARDFDVGV
jgi:hypothetical protein